MSEMSGAAQIAVLKTLNQQAAAYLIGQTARNLRDRSDAPRNEDGTYDGAALVSWWRGRIDADAALGDAEFERVLLFASLLSEGEPFGCEAAGITFVDEMRALRSKYGDGVCAQLVDELVGNLDFFTAEMRRSAFRRPTDADLLHAAREEADEHDARSRMRLVTVCDQCERWRFGRKWKNSVPPKGAIQTPRSLCDECSRAEPPPNKPAPEPENDELDDDDLELNEE